MIGVTRTDVLDIQLLNEDIPDFITIVEKLSKMTAQAGFNKPFSEKEVAIIHRLAQELNIESPKLKQSE